MAAAVFMVGGNLHKSEDGGKAVASQVAAQNAGREVKYQIFFASTS